MSFVGISIGNTGQDVGNTGIGKTMLVIHWALVKYCWFYLANTGIGKPMLGI